MVLFGQVTVGPPNGGFEVPGDGVDGWRGFNLAGEVFQARTVGAVYEGTRALHLERTAAGADARMVPRHIPAAISWTLAGQGSVSFQNCHFIALHPANRADMSLRVRSGAPSLMGCEFMMAGRRQLVLEDAMVGAVVIGNQFSERMRVENRAHGQVQMVGNVDGVPVERQDD